MNKEFIITRESDYPNSNANIRVAYMYISEYEMNDGSIYIYRNYENKSEFLNRIKDEPKNVVRIVGKSRSVDTRHISIYHILKCVLHSEKTTAANYFVQSVDDNCISEESHYYYIDGKNLNKEDWKFYNRKHKLKRITQDEVY